MRHSNLCPGNYLPAVAWIRKQGGLDCICSPQWKTLCQKTFNNKQEIMKYFSFKDIQRHLKTFMTYKWYTYFVLFLVPAKMTLSNEHTVFIYFQGALMSSSKLSSVGWVPNMLSCPLCTLDMERTRPRRPWRVWTWKPGPPWKVWTWKPTSYMIYHTSKNKKKVAESAIFSQVCREISFLKYEEKYFLWCAEKYQTRVLQTFPQLARHIFYTVHNLDAA